MKINQWVILILGIWFSAAIGSIAIKDSDPFSIAGLMTFLIGIGYLLMKL